MAVETIYRDLRDRMGRRPTAPELYHEGYNPKALRSHFGSWFGFVRRMGDLDEISESLLGSTGDFLAHLEITPMTRSYKMLVLLAMLNLDAFPGSVGIATLTREFRRLAERSAKLREDVGEALTDDDSLRRHLERNPINAWTGGRGTGRQSYLSYEEGVVHAPFDLAGDRRTAFQELVRELADWRLAEYLEPTTRCGSPRQTRDAQ